MSNGTTKAHPPCVAPHAGKILGRGHPLKVHGLAGTATQLDGIYIYLMHTLITLHNNRMKHEIGKFMYMIPLSIPIPHLVIVCRGCCCRCYWWWCNTLYRDGSGEEQQPETIIPDCASVWSVSQWITCSVRGGGGGGGHNEGIYGRIFIFSLSRCSLLNRQLPAHNNHTQTDRQIERGSENRKDGLRHNIKET